MAWHGGGGIVAVVIVGSMLVSVGEWTHRQYRRRAHPNMPKKPIVADMDHYRAWCAANPRLQRVKGAYPGRFGKAT